MPNLQETVTANKLENNGKQYRSAVPNWGEFSSKRISGFPEGTTELGVDRV